MRKLLLYLLTFLVLTNITFSQQASNLRANKKKTVAKSQPILVELFTSQGCANCPPAEKNLAYFQLEQPFDNAELITLAFHVDYWNNPNWKDEFSSSLFTQRQKVYDRKFRTGKIYTPQMVVDGERQFVGSSFKKAKKAVSKAVKKAKAQIEISFDKETLNLNISKIPSVKENVTVYLAVAEDNLNVRGQQNNGKTLKHVSVVRDLNGIGLIKKDTKSIKLSSNIQLNPKWIKENLSATVFLQGNSTRKIYGVKRIKL